MNTVRDIFDTAAARYDQRRQAVIPCFADFYQSILRALPFPAEAAIRVLDLGAGTGLVGALILGAYANASIMEVDIAAKMLAKARERFAGDPRAACQVLDYNAEPLPGTFDAVVSALSIHHLQHEDKQLLFAKALAALEPGGVMVNADLVQGHTLAVEEFYQQAWQDHLEASGLPRDQLNDIYRRMSYDITAGLEEQMVWMRAAGFADVACLYKYNNFAVYRGCKA